MFPGVAGPGLGARLTRFRDGVATPLPFAGIDIIGIDIAADAVFAAGNTDDQIISNDQGGNGRAEAVVMAVHLGVPDNGPGFPVQGNHMGVQRGHENQLSGNGRAFIRRPAAHPHVVRQLVFIAPQQLARDRVQGKEVVVCGSQIDDPVGNNGRGLHLGRDTGLEHPGRPQVLDIIPVNVPEWAEPPAGVIAAVHQPIGRIVRPLEQMVLGDGLKSIAVEAAVRGRAGGGLGGGGRRFRRRLIFSGFELGIRPPADRLSIVGGAEQRQTIHPYENSL